MAETRLNRYWAIAIIFLIAVIIITVFVAWSRYRPSQPIEILLPPEQEISGNINIQRRCHKSRVFTNFPAEILSGH